MAIGIKAGNIIDEIGEQDFFHAFFSTVSYHLEQNGWGSRFPILLNKLYQGQLSSEVAGQAIKELDIIRSELKKYSPDMVVWDIENLETKPPWGSNISNDITNLSNYFVTSTGRDLIDTLKECLEELRDRGGVLEVVPI